VGLVVHQSNDLGHGDIEYYSKMVKESICGVVQRTVIEEGV